MATTKVFEHFVNVLGYQEEGKWVALVLEMDIRGYGPTFDKALKELIELVEMQISFAYQNDKPELVWHPADPEWFQVYNHVQAQKLRRAPVTRDYEARGLPIPPPHVIAKMPEFCPADA